ncbi:MAG: hypothetical protein IJB94_07340, partial [Clostridia bacterium]|nr:hypothetical protein [Clostridia bacterium]
MKTRKITGRIASLTLAILLLLTTLVGCVGNKVTPTLPFDDKALIQETPEEMAAHGLVNSQLQKIAEIFSAAYGAKEAFDAREGVVAANRGYDMTA